MGSVEATCRTAPLENCETRGGPHCRHRGNLQEVWEAVGFEGFDHESEERVQPTTLIRQPLKPPDDELSKLGEPTNVGEPPNIQCSADGDAWSAFPGTALCNPATREDLEQPMFAHLGLQGAINLPRGPQRHAVPTYTTNERTELSGELHSGEVVQLRLGERIQKVTLTIFVDGFSVKPAPSAPSNNSLQGYSRAWSPFTLIETCQVQVKKMEQAWAVFKLTILRRKDADMFYYFGCSGDNAEEERDRWVHDISEAIGTVTLSLIPAHSITVRPVPGNSDTVMRLLAGYLMLLIDLEVVALYYCELQAYRGGAAKLALYQDEWCEHEVGAVPILNTSVVSTRKGEYCTVLGVDSSLLCARSWKEKELWLRAVSNVKVKLMFDAPEPTQEELNVYRGAVLERVAEVVNDDKAGEQSAKPLLPLINDGSHPVEDDSSMDGGTVDSDRTGSVANARPLLSAVRGKPKPCPRGDVSQPEPMDTPQCTPRNTNKCLLVQGKDSPPDFTSAFPPIYDGDDYPVPPSISTHVTDYNSNEKGSAVLTKDGQLEKEHTEAVGRFTHKSGPHPAAPNPVSPRAPITYFHADSKDGSGWLPPQPPPAMDTPEMAEPLLKNATTES